MKFLYFGDRHATFKQPGNRLDNFSETCKLKDEEIMSIARREKVSAILQPGDFFEEKDIKGSNDFIKEIISRYNLFNPKELLDNYQKTGILDAKLLENYIPMICVAGNHDLIGESLETLPSTTLGLLSSLGQLNIVTKDNPMFFTTEDGLKVAITGTNYHINMDDPEYIDDYIVKEKLGDIHIHIVHGMLAHKDMGKLIKHTLIDNIMDTKADITLCGHNHIGFGILNINDKYFVNIGSVTRYTGDIKEIGRKPSVAIIDINKSGINIKEIPLTSAMDGSAVIDRSAIEAKKKKREVVENFKNEINELKSSSKKLSISDFVNTVASAKSIDETLRDDILQRIVDKEDEKTKIKNAKSGAYVSKIILENFQSHEYTELDFVNGFNVLMGESRQGKSAIERSFYWVYENKPSGKNFIKRGKDYAKVTIFLSNNTVVSRMVEAKKSGKNVYEIIYPDGNIETGNTKLLPEVQKILGFSNFYIDSKLSLPINFYKQGESWYLIGDNLSSTDKARVIGALNGTNIADAIVRDLDSENNKVLNANKYALEESKKITDELNELQYLDDLKVTIDNNKILLEKYERLQKQKEEIIKIKQRFDSYNDELSKVKSILKELENVPSIIALLERSKNISLNLDSINSYYKNFNNISEELLKTKDILRQIGDSCKYLDRISDLKQGCNNVYLIDKNLHRYEVYNHNNEFNKTILKNLENLDKLKLKLKTIQSLKETLELLNRQKDVYKDLIVKKNNTEDILRQLENLNLLKDTIEKVKELYNTILVLDTKNLELNKYKTKVLEISEILKEFNRLIDIKNNINIIQEKQKEVDELNASYNKYNTTNDNLQKSVIKRKDADINVENKKAEFSKVLKEMQICPICKTPLEDEQIDHIVNND